ncbi:MAG TPA: cyclic pyranopterin monophosphate synthase MoaC [Betaproteobacteria bacterium]|nr:cyclic pyranopterin monophosphate synthase MoaC [Betaproteobacteria bacterium]
MSKFTHFDAEGQARMVDVAGKDETRRVARAAGSISMRPETLTLLLAGGSKKGDVLGVARIAAIQGAKRTADLIPLCHPLALTKIGVDFHIRESAAEIECVATVETLGRTGVEMEALTAVSLAALTVYDMVKAVDKSMTISEIRLVLKDGGKSGLFKAE